MRLERGTLVVSGSADDDAIALAERAGRIEVTLGAETFAFARHKVDRVRVDGGDGPTRSRSTTTGSTCRPPATASGSTTSSSTASRSSRPRPRQLTVGDLSATDVFQVVADADRTTAYGSEDDDQISLGSFGLLGPTFIRSSTRRWTAT